MILDWNCSSGRIPIFLGRSQKSNLTRLDGSPKLSRAMADAVSLAAEASVMAASPNLHQMARNRT